MRPANDNARSSPLKLRQMPHGSLTFAVVATAIAALAIVAGLLSINPPWIARQVRLDTERADDLAALANVIKGYASAQGRLPKSIDELQSSGRTSYRPVIDPVTGAQFEYNPGAENEFKLCATFDRNSKDARTYRDADWPHEAGRVCFTRFAKFKE